MRSARLPSEHQDPSATDPAVRSARIDSAQQPRRASQHRPISQQPKAMDAPAFGPARVGKVAIPPLQPKTDPPPSRSSPEKKRTSKACVECRVRKIKCSGKKPSCEHCEQCQIPCTYAEGKREQNKRATERGDRLLQLVRDISHEVDLPPHLLQKIQAVESEAVDDDTTSLRSGHTTNTKRRRRSSGHVPSEKRKRSRSPHGDHGEADVSADVGSEESVDLAAEDFNRSERARATGFVGKNSEVAWAHRLSQAQSEKQSNYESSRGPYGLPGNSEEARLDRMAAARARQKVGNKQAAPMADFTYHLDMESVLTLDHVDKNELPPLETAKRLLNCYLSTVQDTLPILAKSDILNQFRHFSRLQNPESIPATWRSILNMVFAIGAMFSHLTNAFWQGDERDHFVYYTRALHLGLPGDVITAHPDLQRIQVLGLISFYYLAISQVSRSWVMIGLACRHAIALGLHLRNIDESMSAFAKEKRVKVWWSLYYIEHLLCEITGRPTTLDPRFCSVPPPMPIEEMQLAQSPGGKQLGELRGNKGGSEPPLSRSKQSSMDSDAPPNAANFFRCQVQLAVISQKLLVNLYSAHTVTMSWEQAQDQIIALGEEADKWYRALPAQYQFILPENEEKTFSRERTLLAFSYYSMKIILTRPCLCRIDKRIVNQGEESKHIDLRKARECVMASKSICDLLPDTELPDIVWIYSKGPWWCIVHHLMQAMTVLMLELAFGVCHMPDPEADQESIIQLAKKLLRWLTMMAAVGHAGAQAACKQARDQFKGFDPFENIDTSDLVKMAEHGPDFLRQELVNQGQLDPKRLHSDGLASKLGPSVPGVGDQSQDKQNVWPKAEQPVGPLSPFQIIWLE
ncbi:fungal-specific transcription factor domain-containing protein [Macrophomina phaseolina]|uniref:Fungal-specific transcription factor domain-containing protein n=1 Tax=Macrophomina phaseolina TaxID=35725 RepID=A0ABQ8FPN8_9PEZI|nr:fungal-specific transcription factor domain-containing protein [Macrophomina phaseolina]